MAIVAIEAVVYRVITAKGVQLTGDEPHYLVVARALTEFTFHPLRAYQADLRTHQIFHWPAGTAATNLNLQLYTGPHGPVPTHSLGLSLLLAPFVALGGDELPRLGLIALEAAGFIYFFIRAAGLAGLQRPGRVVFAVVVASPAIWLAGTQIYPDFLTGVLMAASLADVWALESRGRLEGWATGVTAASLATLPWLHQQNLVPAAIILVAVAVVAVRRQQVRTAVVVAAVAIASWALLLVYNLDAYGHPLGLPQPFPSLNGAGVTEILGLLLDRHQGLFVEVPTALIGVIGMWLAGRRAPTAVTATLTGSLSLLYLNGTFIHAPYGGTSFAGRFEWSSLVPILVWSAVAVARLADRSARRLWGVGATVVVLWAAEAAPILRGDHVFYNQFTSGPPWDPSRYPGWWMAFDRLLPEMDPGGPLFGTPSFALPLAIVASLGAVALFWVVVRPTTPASWRLGAVAAIVIGASSLLAVDAPLPLPSGPLTFTDSDVGGPLLGGGSTTSTPTVALTAIGAGSYRLSVAYSYSLRGGGAGSASISAYCTSGGSEPPGPGPQSEQRPAFPGNHQLVLNFRCPTGAMWYKMETGPAGDLFVTDLRLSKTSSA